MLHTWLKVPHVKEYWYQDESFTYEEIHEKYSKRIKEGVVESYIIQKNKKDIGFIQTYYIDDPSSFMVKDKINYRARGPNTNLTRQPVQGRANDGGLRIGEMERDGIMGHGLSYFLNESYMVRGDQYYMAVCNKTGTIAIYNPDKNLFLRVMVSGSSSCISSPARNTNSLVPPPPGISPTPSSTRPI